MIRTTPREFALYVGASGCAFMADVAILFLLVRMLDVHYLAAVTVSYTSGAILAYLLCVKFVFHFRRLDSPGPEFGMFWGIGMLGLAVNAAAMAIGMELFHLHLLVAKTGAAAITFAMNFALRKLLLFAPLQTSATLSRSRDISQ